MDPEQVVQEDESRDLDGAEGPMKELAENIENGDTQSYGGERPTALAGQDSTPTIHDLKTFQQTGQLL